MGLCNLYALAFGIVLALMQPGISSGSCDHEGEYVTKMEGLCFLSSATKLTWMEGSDSDANDLNVQRGLECGETEYELIAHAEKEFIFRPHTFQLQEFCSHYDYNTVSILDPDFTESIQEYLTDTGRSGSYWTGGSDLLKDGVWYWENFFLDREFRDWDYSNWAPGHPVCSSNCLYVENIDGSLLWYSDDCAAKKRILCMYYYD